MKTTVGDQPHVQEGYGNQSCHRCGRANHAPEDWRFKDAECHQCGKKGHISPVCRSKTPSQRKPLQKQKRRCNKTHHVQEHPPTPDSEGSSGEEYHLHKVGTHSSHPMEVQVMVNEQRLTMEVDTGAAVSIISDATRKAKFPRLKLHKSDVILKTYIEEPMEVIGNLHVRVRYGDQEAKLVLVVVGGEGPCLFGRNWLKYIRLNWHSISTVQRTQL